jgi:hypothetical protein
MTDLFTLAIVAGAALYGWHRGALSMALIAGGLFGGYVAALLLFRPLGNLIASASGMPELVAYPLAGMLALMGTSGAVNAYTRLHRRRRAAQQAEDEDWEPARADQVGGAVIGGVYGIALAVFVSWAATSFGGMYGASEMAAVRESVTGRVSTQVVQRAVMVPARAVVGDRFVAGGVARMVADPFKAIGALNRMMANEDMQELLGNGAILEAARLQDPAGLASNATLRELAGNEQFAAAMRTFGLAEQGSGAVDPGEVADALVREAGPALRSVDRLMEDPEISRILESDAFRQTWEEGDFMRMAQEADFRQLFDRVLEELRQNR